MSALPDESWTWDGGKARVFEVDDGDGSGAEPRCDITLRSTGEAGSGGKLQRMRREQVESLISVLRDALAKMLDQPPVTP